MRERKSTWKKVTERLQNVKLTFTKQSKVRPLKKGKKRGTEINSVTDSEYFLKGRRRG